MDLLTTVHSVSLFGCRTSWSVAVSVAAPLAVSGGGFRVSAPTMMIKETSLRRDPDLRGELAFLARGCDFVLPSRFKKRLKSFQQQQVSRCSEQEGTACKSGRACTMQTHDTKYAEILIFNLMCNHITDFVSPFLHTHVLSHVSTHRCSHIMSTHTVNSSCCPHTHRVTCQGRQTIQRQIPAGY